MIEAERVNKTEKEIHETVFFQASGVTLDQGLRPEADLYFLLHTTKDRKGDQGLSGKAISPV